jgi:hypothetical protein
MRFTGALALAWALAGVTAAAQQPPPRDAADLEARRGTAIVRGRVTDAETGAPMRRVTLSLSLVGGRAQVDTTSDADGSFEFTRVPAGSYSLLADPMGTTTHRPASYGAVPGKPPGRRSTIVLRDGQLFENADIALPRSFVISARVVDEAGDPVPDVQVAATAFDGDARSTRTRTTDDRGMVRLWGYAPGAYRVCAMPDNAPQRGTAEAFIRTCYPSAISVSEAQPLVVTNADSPEVEIRLRRSRLFRISGFVLDASGALATSASVSLVTVDDDSYSSRSVQAEGGAFSVHGVVPGQYYIKADVGHAFSSDDGTRQSGYSAAHVQTSDVENLAVLLSPASTVRGRLVFDGGPAPPMAGVMVQANPVPNTIAIVGARGDAVRVNADLTFELRGLFGPHTVQVNGFRGWVTASMRYRGDERLNVPTEFRAGADEATLDIVLTNRQATLIARVFDDKGQAVEDGRLVLFPADARQWDVASAVRSATRRGGGYEVSGLRPAEYLVAVVPDWMGSVNARRLLEELSKQAERITLADNEQRTIDLVSRR